MNVVKEQIKTIEDPKIREVLEMMENSIIFMVKDLQDQVDSLRVNLEILEEKQRILKEGLEEKLG